MVKIYLIATALASGLAGIQAMEGEKNDVLVPDNSMELGACTRGELLYPDREHRFRMQPCGYKHCMTAIPDKGNVVPSRAHTVKVPRTEMTTATRKKTCIVKQTHHEHVPILVTKKLNGEKIINTMENTTLRVHDDEPKTYIKKGIAELWRRCGVYTFVHFDELRRKLGEDKVPQKYWKYLNENCHKKEAERLAMDYERAEKELKMQVETLQDEIDMIKQQAEQTKAAAEEQARISAQDQLEHYKQKMEQLKNDMRK